MKKFKQNGKIKTIQDLKSEERMRAEHARQNNPVKARRKKNKEARKSRRCNR